MSLSNHLFDGSSQRPATAPTLRNAGLDASKDHYGDPLTTLYGSIRPMLDRGHVILHFVSALPGEGVSTIARDFASMAGKRGHRRTLLIDGNLHNPTTARMFNASADRGLLDDLRNNRPLDQAVALAPEQGFWVGNLCGTDQISDLRMQEVRQAYTTFKSQFDLTIIDCAAISAGNYADMLPEMSDGVIMVIQAEATRPIVVARARNVIEQLGGNVIGAVLNRRKDYIPDSIYRYL